MSEREGLPLDIKDKEKEEKNSRESKGSESVGDPSTFAVPKKLKTPFMGPRTIRDSTPFDPGLPPPFSISPIRPRSPPYDNNNNNSSNLNNNLSPFILPSSALDDPVDPSAPKPKRESISFGRKGSRSPSSGSRVTGFHYDLDLNEAKKNSYAKLEDDSDDDDDEDDNDNIPTNEKNEQYKKHLDEPLLKNQKPAYGTMSPSIPKPFGSDSQAQNQAPGIIRGRSRSKSSSLQDDNIYMDSSLSKSESHMHLNPYNMVEPDPSGPISISIIGETPFDDPNPNKRVRKFSDIHELLLPIFAKGEYPENLAPIWIAVEDASQHDYYMIGNHFGLHPLTIEDCQSTSTREKLEIFHNYLFIVFHALRCDDDTFSSDPFEDVFPTSPIRVLVFPNCVLSFSRTVTDIVSLVRYRLFKFSSHKLDSTAWLIHAMLDCIVDSLLPLVESTTSEVDVLDDLIYVLSGSEHRDLLKRMSLTRRRLLFLRQRLWSKRDILMSLIGKDWQLFLNNVQVPYMRDVYDHVVTMLHKVDSASEFLFSVQNTYLANVSIDVAEASHSSNRVMKNLSAVATIILPLTLIAGLMGMNCEVPFQFDTDNTFYSLLPFSSICLSMLLIAIILTVYFKQRDLL